MDRRGYLAAVGIAVAPSIGGCLGDDTPGGGTDGTDGTDGDGTSDGTDDDGTDDGDGTDEQGAGGAIDERFDCADADRPTPDVATGVDREVTIGNETTVHESVGSVEYPDPPADVDGEAAREFVREHERAYQRNSYAERYGEDLIELDVMVEAVASLDRYDDVETVRVDFAVHVAAITDGGLVTTEPAGEAAAYAIDDTGLARAETEYRDLIDGSISEETTDPFEEGEILACF